MGIEQGLHLKQSQSMVMTPQLQQSIKILQLASLDLAQYISGVVEQNPFLDQHDDGSVGNLNENEEFESSQGEERDHAVDKNTESNWEDAAISPAIYDESGGAERVYSNTSSGGGSGDYGGGDYSLENISSSGETLREHIIDQIHIDITDPVQKMIAFHLTDQLDESGYVSLDLASLSNTLKCSTQEIEEVFDKVQKFDPPGVFARSLSECLALQLKDKDRYDPAMKKLIKNLDLLGKREYKRLQKICAVSEEDLALMCQEIHELNPKPGSVFGTDVVQTLRPDIFLKEDGKGGWRIDLNSEALPKALVNRTYYAEIIKKIKDKEEKKFLVEQMSQANFIVKALDQRANTILKVSAEIVSRQDMFFRQGIKYLKPMILSDIAKEVDMHESTISRVINGKYIATSMGVFELRYFFTSSVSKDGDEGQLSSTSVKYMIKELINSEDPKSVLSDDKITKILKEKGIDIARRTVLKYRESMKIPSSVQRRRDKKSLL
ncbi:RNA polymerase factor sigma-54 [Rickettsiales bacterium]|nr:RNA polymerase factor sigma-54 [Rickettsiales bacterium]